MKELDREAISVIPWGDAPMRHLLYYIVSNCQLSVREAVPGRQVALPPFAVRFPRGPLG